MKEYKAIAHINSLKGEMAEITVLDKVGDNDYIVDYKGVKCHALLTGLFANITPTIFTGELNNEIHFYHYNEYGTLVFDYYDDETHVSQSYVFTR